MTVFFCVTLVLQRQTGNHYLGICNLVCESTATLESTSTEASNGNCFIQSWRKYSWHFCEVSNCGL